MKSFQLFETEQECGCIEVKKVYFCEMRWDQRLAVQAWREGGPVPQIKGMNFVNGCLEIDKEWDAGDLEPVLLENTDRKIMAHASGECSGTLCPIHKRTDHHMRSWPQLWREDRKIMERTCPHGVGHPDPDDPRCFGPHTNGYEALHGCDGCCDQTAVTHDKEGKS